MSKRDLDEQLGAMADMSVPAPSAALLEMVRMGGASATRKPWRDLGVIVGVAGALAVLYTWRAGVRSDLAALPSIWFYATLAAWTFAFVTPLAVALMPRRGSVLADSGRAALLALAVPTLVTAMSIWLRVDAPGATVIPAAEQQLHYIRSCLTTGLMMAAIPLVASFIALRRAALPSDTRWLGAAIGAANGSLAGGILHAHCSMGGVLHVTMGHASAATVGAIVGAIVVPAVVRRGR